MVVISVSVDVPDLARGIEFYSRAFGFLKASEPAPGVVVMRAGNTEICLLEKDADSQPSQATTDTRRYDRHWTPVHLDIQVDNLEEALAKATDAGAKCEQLFQNPEHGSVAFCSDPFGHGFCLIERKT